MPPFSPREVYNLVAAGFDRPALRFWSLFGQGLVRAAQLKSGEHVLDIGCGTGAAALPAARAVGPQGSVIGVDIAEKMVARARERAREARLLNAAFETADVSSYSPERKFEVILGAFSLFFFEDIPATLAKLRTLTAPEGRWAFSFWGDRSFEGPARTLKRDIEDYLPTPFAQPLPWERFSTPGKIRDVFAQVGYRAEISRELPDYFLSNAQEWWEVVMNSGYRKYVEMIPAGRRDEFRASHLAHVEKQHLTPRGISLYLPAYYVVVRL